MPRLDSQTSIVIKSDVLANAINKTIFATGNDDLRPVMSGVYCQFNENNSIFVATDAHKLVRYTRNDARAGASASFIMPKKPLNVLRGLLTGVDDLQADRRQIPELRGGDTQTESQQAER